LILLEPEHYLFCFFLASADKTRFIAKMALSELPTLDGGEENQANNW
jgi:hypothetical protein